MAAVGMYVCFFTAEMHMNMGKYSQPTKAKSKQSRGFDKRASEQRIQHCRHGPEETGGGALCSDAMACNATKQDKIT